MSLPYRADIDGVRAIAVSIVVLFHAGFFGITGGFIGVDVFFVISGYLITGILFRELAETGRVSLAGFYARRLARIVPSLVLVIAVTLAAAALLLSSTLFEVQSATKSAVAALAFVPNLHFLAITQTYFAADTANLPLLHTWSLGVEEQYYLVWPPLLMLAALGAARGDALRRRCLGAIALIGLASLVYCAVLTVRAPGQAFYSPLPRIWELGVGSALALAELRRRAPRAGSALALAGLALIAAGTFAAREGGSGFPWPLALLPVLGTAALIRGNGLAPHGPAARLLSTRPMVAVGKVSYAWYLWHWPPLAFAHILAVSTPSAPVRAAIVIATLLAAFATVRWHEDPLRRWARTLPQRRAIAAGLLALLAAAGLSAAVYGAARLHWLPDDANLQSALTDRPPLQDTCLESGNSDGQGAFPAPCLAPAGTARVIVWGDSHGDQWMPAVSRWTAGKAAAPEQLTRAACPPLLAVRPFAAGAQVDQACIAFNRRAVARIAATREAAIVVLSSNWLPRTRAPEAGGNPPWFDVAAGNPAESVAALERGLDASLAELDRLGRPAIVVLQSPLQDRIPAACVARLGAERCGLARSAFDHTAAAVNGAIRAAAARHPRAVLLDPAAILCTPGTCPARIDGRIAYFDIEHVAASLAGSPRAAAVWAPALDRAWSGLAPR